VLLACICQVTIAQLLQCSRSVTVCIDAALVMTVVTKSVTELMMQLNA